MSVVRTEHDFREEALEIGYEGEQINIYVQHSLFKQEIEKEIFFLDKKLDKLLDEKRKYSVSFTKIDQEHRGSLDEIQAKIRQGNLSYEEVLMLDEEIKQANLNKKKKNMEMDMKFKKIDEEIKDVMLEVEEKYRELFIGFDKFVKEIDALWSMDEEDEETEEEILTCDEDDQSESYIKYVNEQLSLTGHNDQNGSNMRNNERHAIEATSEKVTLLIETKALDATETKTDDYDSRLPAARGDDGREDAMEMKGPAADHEMRMNVEMSKTEGGQGKVTVTERKISRLCEEDKGKQSTEELTGASVIVRAMDHMQVIGSYANEVREGELVSGSDALQKVTGIDHVILECHRQQLIDEWNRSCLINVEDEYGKLSYKFKPPVVLLLMKLQVSNTVATKDLGLKGKPPVRNLWPVDCKSMMTWQIFLIHIVHVNVHENFSITIVMPRTGIGTYCKWRKGENSLYLS